MSAKCVGVCQGVDMPALRPRFGRVCVYKLSAKPELTSAADMSLRDVE